MNKIKDFIKELRLLFRNVPAVLVSLLFVGIVGMNILANKSIDLPVDWLALDAGLILSWLVFFVMDVTVKRFGLRAANTISVAALIVNLFVALIFFLASLIPGTWSTSYVEGSEAVINSAFDGMFKGTWYIIVGSSAAFIASAIVNNVLAFLIHKAFKNKTTFKAFVIASYVSTMVGQFVDNFLFALIVSKVFFGWSMIQCLTCAASGMVLELVCELIFAPLGYYLVKRMERDKVGQDYVDYMNRKKELKNESVN